MWVGYKTVNTLIAAQMWMEILEGEGLPVRLLPINGILYASENTAFRVMVPRGREHVADEILRKL